MFMQLNFEGVARDDEGRSTLISEVQKFCFEYIVFMFKSIVVHHGVLMHSFPLSSSFFFHGL